VVVSHGP